MAVDCDSPLLRLTTGQQHGFKVIFCIVAIAATLLNALVLGIFLIKRSLRIIANVLYISLAICDLLLGAGLSPVTIIQLSFTDKQRSCLANKMGALLVSLLAVNALNVSAIAYDQFIHVTRIKSYKLLMTKKRKICLVIIPWLAPMIMIPARFVSEQAFSWVTVILYPSSYLILAYSYLRLIWFLRKSKVSAHHNEDSTLGNNMRSVTIRRNRRANRLIFLILTLSLVCLIGIILYRFLKTVDYYNRGGLVFFDTRGPLLFVVGQLMFQLKAALNPVLYFLKHQEVRRTLIRILPKGLIPRLNHERIPISSSASIVQIPAPLNHQVPTPLSWTSQKLPSACVNK